MYIGSPHFEPPQIAEAETDTSEFEALTLRIIKLGTAKNDFAYKLNI